MYKEYTIIIIIIIINCVLVQWAEDGPPSQKMRNHYHYKRHKISTALTFTNLNIGHAQRIGRRISSSFILTTLYIFLLLVFAGDVESPQNIYLSFIYGLDETNKNFGLWEEGGLARCVWAKIQFFRKLSNPKRSLSNLSQPKFLFLNHETQ